MPKREGGTIHQVLADDAATLVYLAGQNVITPHVWTSRADRLEQPDRLIFDLDPSTRRFAEVRAAARRLGDLLRDLGLAPFAMTTGSRGLHVVVPLRRTADYDAVHDFARAVAAALVETDPDALTVEFRRENRGERIFVDVGRNAYGQHAVAPYAVRPLPTAPVATPLRWEELGDRGLARRAGPSPRSATASPRRRSVARHRPPRAVDRPRPPRAQAGTRSARAPRSAAGRWRRCEGVPRRPKNAVMAAANVRAAATHMAPLTPVTNAWSALSWAAGPAMRPTTRPWPPMTSSSRLDARPRTAGGQRRESSSHWRVARVAPTAPSTARPTAAPDLAGRVDDARGDAGLARVDRRHRGGRGRRHGERQPGAHQDVEGPDGVVAGVHRELAQADEAAAQHEHARWSSAGAGVKRAWSLPAHGPISMTIAVRGSAATPDFCGE